MVEQIIPYLGLKNGKIGVCFFKSEKSILGIIKKTN